MAQTQHPHAEDEIETLWLPERHSDSSEDIRKLVTGDQGTSIVDLYAENRGRSRRCMRMGQAEQLHGQTARLDARFFSINGYFGDDSSHKSSPRRHHGTSSFNDNDSKVRQPPPMAKVQSGATIDALMNFLEQQSGGKGTAPGYSFPHIPATGNLTIGGVLAINGHGTAIPVLGEDICTSYGSLSNRILAFTAVVTDPDGATPDRYAIREFNRGEGDDRAFLAHLGRAFLLDATLEVIDNYNMRCQSFVDISPNVLFQAPTPESSNGHESLMTFLQTTGRAEVLWYPLSDKAWLKVWTVTKSKPHTSTAVKLPYNYPFSHNMSKFQGLFLKTVIHLWPSLTPRFSPHVY